MVDGATQLVFAEPLDGEEDEEGEEENEDGASSDGDDKM